MKPFTLLRVLRQDRDQYLLQAASGLVRADLAGSFRHSVQTATDLPVVGDIVHCQRDSPQAQARIIGLEPRRNAFMRKVPISGGRHMVGGQVAGGKTEAQILAANIDAACIVVGADQDANPRRLERYLLMLLESAIPALVIINKIDLQSDSGYNLEQQLRTVIPPAMADSVPVLRISALRGIGLEQLDPWLQPGQAVVFVGSSGAGKTSLLASLGAAAGSSAALSSSTQKGRHTTSRRESFWLPGGYLVIDTPGIRELQLWCDTENVNELFADIHALASRCRYPRCSHQSEAGCAIQAAVTGGQISRDRLDSWLKLQAESRRLERRQRDRKHTGRPHQVEVQPEN